MLSRERPRGRLMAHRNDLDVVRWPKHVKLEGFIDLDLLPDDMPPATNLPLECEDHDNYIQDIPGVRTFGVKRARPNHTAPSKLQTVTTWNTNGNLLPKKLDFSPTEKPVSTLATCKGDTCGTDSGKVMREQKPEQKAMGDREHSGKVKREQKPEPKAVSDREHSGKVKREQKPVTDLEQLRLYESLSEKLSTQKVQFTNLANGFKEDITEKEGLIARLQRENSDLKQSLLEQSREKEGLIMRHDRETADLKDQLIREIEGSKDFLREQSAEKEGLINRHKREMEDLKTSFSIEKALIEDRHRQQMAAYRSAILTVVLSQTTPNHEAQSSVLQVTKHGTSGGVGKP